MLGPVDVAKAIAALALPGAASEAAAALVDVIADRVEGEDQATLKRALAQARADNDAGHERLQDKLVDAAKR